MIDPRLSCGHLVDVCVTCGRTRCHRCFACHDESGEPTREFKLICEMHPHLTRPPKSSKAVRGAVDILLVEWMAQTVHQAYHGAVDDGDWRDCSSAICQASRDALDNPALAEGDDGKRLICGNNHPEISWRDGRRCPLCKEREAGYKLAERVQDAQSRLASYRDDAKKANALAAAATDGLMQSRTRAHILELEVRQLRQWAKTPAGKAARRESEWREAERARDKELLKAGRNLAALDESEESNESLIHDEDGG